jgi:hypothetical protein
MRLSPSTKSIPLFALFALVGLLGVAAGCGSATSQVEASIGPGGGSLTLPSPAVRLDVPAGALKATTTVSLRASADAQSVLVAIDPAQLALAAPAQLSVSLQGPRHISSVTEVSQRGEQPIGVDARIEGASGASVRLHLDHFTQVRLSTDAMSDAGTVPGACQGHGDGMGDDDQDGEGDGEHHDGGGDDDRPDAGVLASAACPAGFECDDGVCVAPGGNDEHHDDCQGADAGSCSDDHEDDHPDGGHP